MKDFYSPEKWGVIPTCFQADRCYSEISIVFLFLFFFFLFLEKRNRIIKHIIGISPSQQGIVGGMKDSHAPGTWSVSPICSQMRISNPEMYVPGNEIRCGLRDLVFVITINVRDTGVFAGVALHQVINNKGPVAT